MGVQRHTVKLRADLTGQHAAAVPSTGKGDLAPFRQSQKLPLLLGVQSAPDQPGLAAEIPGNGLVDVVAAQMVIACDGNDLHHILKAVHHADIQCTAAEVDNQQAALALRPALAVIQCRCRWLIDKPLDRQSRQLRCQPCGTALIVVEIGRHTDDRLFDLLPQGFPGVLGQLPQHQGRQLLRQEPSAAQDIFLLRPHPGFE